MSMLQTIQIAALHFQQNKFQSNDKLSKTK